MSTTDIIQIVALGVLWVVGLWRVSTQSQSRLTKIEERLKNHKIRQERFERELSDHKKNIYEKMDNLETEMREMVKSLAEMTGMMKIYFDQHHEKK